MLKDISIQYYCAHTKEIHEKLNRMPKRKRVQSEEGDDSSACSRVTNTNKTSGRGKNRRSGKLPPTGTAISPGKRQKSKKVVTPERCTPKKPKIAEGFVESFAKCTSVRQERSAVRKSPRGKTSDVQLDNLKRDFCSVLVPNRQLSSNELAQSNGHNLWTELSAYSNRSSRDVIPIVSEIKKKSRDLQTKENASLNELDRKTVLKSNTKSDGESCCCRRGERRRSARIRSRENSSPPNLKMHTKKTTQSRCSKCLNSASPIMEMSDSLVRKSFDSEVFLKKAYTCESEVLGSYKNNEDVISGSVRQSVQQQPNEKCGAKSYNTKSRNDLLEEKCGSNTASESKNICYLSRRTKQRAYNRTASSMALNCDEARNPSIVLLDIRNKFSGPVPQTVYVKNSKYCHMEHIVAPYVSEKELRIEQEQCVLLSSNSGSCGVAVLRNFGQNASNKPVGTEKQRTNYRKSDPQDVYFFSWDQICMFPVTSVRKSTNSEFSIFANFGVQNLLEMLDVCKSPAALRKAFTASSSHDFCDNKPYVSLYHTMCRLFSALTTKRLMCLDALALNLSLPERKIAEIAIHVISGLRRRLLEEYRSRHTDHDFVVSVKKVLLNPVLFAGSSDLILESSLLQRSSRTGSQVLQKANSVEMGCGGTQSDSLEILYSPFFSTLDKGERTREDSISVSQQVVRSLVPIGNVRRDKHVYNRTGYLSSPPRNGSHADRTGISTDQRKVLRKDRFRRVREWPVTPQERKIQLTLDKCLKNRALSKLPKVKTTQELVHELFDKSRCEVPLSLEKYLIPSASRAGRSCENSVFDSPVQTCLEISSQLSEPQRVNPVTSLHCENRLEFGQADMSRGLLQLPVNESGLVATKDWKDLNETSADLRVCTAAELSDVSNSSSSVDVLEQFPGKDQHGEWHVECVDGNFDCYGNWKEFTECCEKESYNGEKLLILPWINLDW